MKSRLIASTLRPVRGDSLCAGGTFGFQTRIRAPRFNTRRTYSTSGRARHYMPANALAAFQSQRTTRYGTLLRRRVVRRHLAGEGLEECDDVPNAVVIERASELHRRHDAHRAVEPVDRAV